MAKLLEPSDIDRGSLEVGRNGLDIIINHPNLEPDANGVGHIVFSPRQARHLARILMKHAKDALQEYNQSLIRSSSPGTRTRLDVSHWDQ